MAKTKSRAVSGPVESVTRKSVDIKKANNGYVVSQWGDKGEKVFIAKNQAEAQKRAGKLLKI